MSYYQPLLGQGITSERDTQVWHPLKSEYINRTSWGAKRNIFKRLLTTVVNTADPLFMARASFELAATASNESDQVNFVEQSLNHLFRARESKTTSLSTRAHTDLLFANFPMLCKLHLEEEHPEMHVMSESLTSGVTALKTLTMKRYPDNEVNESIGAAAELGVLVMLQRFSIESLEGSDWTPVQSLLSEDCTRKTRLGVPRHSWDVSVFTGPDADLTYPVQVKYGVEHTEYDEEIVRVNVRNDLILPGERFLSIQVLMGEIQQSTLPNPNSGSVRNLNARTDILVQLLDSAA